MASGVQITGLIKPLNGGAFPVFEDINGLGGWRSVTNLAARDAIAANSRKVGMVVVDEETGIAWQLVGDITNADWVTLAVFYQYMQQSDSEMPQRRALNFSLLFGLTDDADGNATKVTIAPAVLQLTTAPDLATLATYDYPDGSAVFVLDQGETYRLYFDNTFAPFSPLIVPANEGGNWIKRSLAYVVGNFTLWVSLGGLGIGGFTPGQLLATATIDPDILLTSALNPGSMILPDILGNLWFGSNSATPAVAAKFALRDCLETSSPTAQVVVSSSASAFFGGPLVFDKQNNLWTWGGTGAGSNILEKYTQPECATTGTKIPQIRISFAVNNAARDMLFDQYGNLWAVFDNGITQTVSMFSAAQLLVTTAAAVPAVVWSGTNFLHPAGIALGPTGLLWVGDVGNGGSTSRVKAYNPVGAVTGNQAPVLTIDAAIFHGGGASRLAFDSDGNLWVAIQDNSQVARFDAASLTTSGTKVPSVIIDTNSGAEFSSLCYPNNPTRSGLVASGMPLAP